VAKNNVVFDNSAHKARIMAEHRASVENAQKRVLDGQRWASYDAQYAQYWASPVGKAWTRMAAVRLDRERVRPEPLR
jgi:hypothetical protein